MKFREVSDDDNDYFIILYLGRFGRIRILQNAVILALILAVIALFIRG